MVVEGPIVEETLVEKFANEKMVVEGSGENTVIKKMKVDSFLIKLFGVEDL